LLKDFESDPVELSMSFEHSLSYENEEQFILSFSPTTAPSPNPTPEPTPAPTPNPTPGPTPSPTPAPTPNPTPGPTPSPTPEPTLDGDDDDDDDDDGHTPDPTGSPIGSGSFVCDYDRTISYKCGTRVFICNSEDMDSTSEDVCKQQTPGANDFFEYEDTLTEAECTQQATNAGKTLGQPDYVPPEGCFCIHMRKGVEPGGFSSGFLDDIKCPPGSNGRNNGISNYACYYEVGVTTALSDPLKENSDSSTDVCKGTVSKPVFAATSVASIALTPGEA
jgi:hypothetical protein